MASPSNLRKVGREELNQPKIAIMVFEKKSGITFRFVTVLNLSVKGVLIESDIDFKKEFKLNLFIKNYELNQWDSFFCRVAWRQASDGEEHFNIGLEFLFHVENFSGQSLDQANAISPDDLDYLLNIELVQTLSGKSLCTFLNCLSRKIIKADSKFISFGDKSDCLYFIQKGHCTVQKKGISGEYAAVGYKRPGELVGNVSLLSDELRTENVISKSDMVLWELKKNNFDKICNNHPEIRTFLTRLYTDTIEDSIKNEIRMIGQYRLHHLIKKGNHSVVYKGLHKSLNLPAAVKMIMHHVSDDSEFKKFLDIKPKIVNRLNHPNVLQVYDIATAYKTTFMIMEYVEGEILSDLLYRKKVLPFERALKFLLQICSGLSFLHDNKIIHQNLIPEKFFVLENDHIKIMGSGPAFSKRKEDFDQTSLFCYMPPERIVSGKMDTRSNIYSFGILAYEMLTGKKPFSANDPAMLMKLHTDTPIPDPSILIPNFPTALKDLIFKACAKSPGKRFASMNEVLEELTQIALALKVDISSQTEAHKEVTILHMTHTKSQKCAVNKLLNEISSRADDMDVHLTIAGRTDST